MKFQWKSVNHIDEDLFKLCVELEYKLRPIITRFLIVRLERECSGDFSSFHFDVDLSAREITISDKTPSKFAKKIQRDFELEINRNVVRNFFDLNSPASSY